MLNPFDEIVTFAAVAPFDSVPSKRTAQSASESTSESDEEHLISEAVLVRPRFLTATAVTAEVTGL